MVSALPRRECRPEDVDRLRRRPLSFSNGLGLRELLVLDIRLDFFCTGGERLLDRATTSSGGDRLRFLLLRLPRGLGDRLL